MNWKDFQTQIKDLFAATGCLAQENHEVRGARTIHEIDVYVEFPALGYKCVWAVECKYWNTNISKEKVLVLRSVVEDIGADKGVMVSKQGFQSGAVLAASRTNVILTDYEDLKAYLDEEIAMGALSKLLTRIARLQARIFDMHPKPHIIDLGNLAIIELKVKDAISSRWPISTPIDLETETFEKIGEPLRFHQCIDRIVSDIESRYQT